MNCCDAMWLMKLWMRGVMLLVAVSWTGCAPTARVSEPAERPAAVEEASAVEEPVTAEVPVREPGEKAAEVAEVEEPAAGGRERFDPENPDWPLRYQELYELYLARFEAPAAGSEVSVTLAAGREFAGTLLELTEKDVLIEAEGKELRLGSELMAPESQARFFADRHAHLFARHHAKREYDAWKAAHMPEEEPERNAPSVPAGEVVVRPRNTEGLEVDPLHGRRRVRANAEPPKNEPPSGRVRQVEQYILRHAGAPESLRVNYWGKVQPHGDGYTVRVRYSLEGAAGFGRSNEDMIFFMYADGTVYQRAAYRGH